VVARPEPTEEAPQGAKAVARENVAVSVYLSNSGNVVDHGVPVDEGDASATI